MRPLLNPLLLLGLLAGSSCRIQRTNHALADPEPALPGAWLAEAGYVT